MPSKADTIVLVFDEFYGDRLAELAVPHPVWICESTVNRPAAQRLWDSGLTSGEITLFAAEAGFTDTLDMLDLHHPRWSQLLVIGLKPTSEIDAALSSHANGMIQATAEGFVFKRLPR